MIKEPHKGKDGITPLTPNDNQIQPSCSTKKLKCFPSLESSQPFSKETIEALEELGEVLRNIQHRMTKEGYELVDGKIRKMIP